MNNFFLLPVAKPPAEPAPEGQPPVEGQVFATVLEEVEQAEASKDLEEKATAAPDALPVAVPLPPAPAPAQTPVPVMDRATETEMKAESGSPANSNFEAAAVKRPQAFSQRASGWELLPTTSQPPVTIQSPGLNPGIGKERAHPPIQETPKQTSPSPDLTPARQPAPPVTGHPTIDLRPETALQGAPPLQDGQPVDPRVRVKPAAEPKPAAPPVQVTREMPAPPPVPAEIPPQGSARGVPSSVEDGGHPSVKTGRDPGFPAPAPAGSIQETGKETFKPAAKPSPEATIETSPKAGLRPPGVGVDPNGEYGTQMKTAAHGPKQAVEAASGERPFQPAPASGGTEPRTVFVRQQQPASIPVEVSVVRPAFSEAPGFADPALAFITDSEIGTDERRAPAERAQTRPLPEIQGRPGHGVRPFTQAPQPLVQRFEAQAGLVPAETATEAASPPGLLSAATPLEGRPGSEQPVPAQTIRSAQQAPENEAAGQTLPAADHASPARSFETSQAMSVDGSHQNQPGEPSEMPEIKRHLPGQQEQTAPTVETQSPPKPWPAFGRAQAEISAGRMGTGTVLTHPLTTKPEAYPVNAPAETIYPSEAAKLPETEIPVNELPKPATVQIPTASPGKIVADEFAGKSAQQLASAPAEGPDKRPGVRKADKGSPQATDPPKLEYIQRGELGLNNNLTRVEIPQPASEPARLAEAQSSRIIEQLNNHVRRAVQAGHTSLHLQLHPKELGQIDLELTSRLDGLQITFTTDNPETGKLLAFHLKELQQSLTEAGVQLSGLSIGQDQTNGTARRDTRRGAPSKETPASRAGNDLKISGETAADGGPAGWTSAVNYQI